MRYAKKALYLNTECNDALSMVQSVISIQQEIGKLNVNEDHLLVFLSLLYPCYFVLLILY